MALPRASEASRGARESKAVLYVVATPIGNLEDITLRALKVLKLVGLVAAEDTRRTGILLRHFDIDCRILSVHEHNEQSRVEKVISYLTQGHAVALVTDAGTPGISDPGAALVHAVRSAGFRVEPIPGASAVIAAISASGITSKGFTFLGFPPFRLKDRKHWFQNLVSNSRDRAVVFFEAPHKLQKTLAELANLVKQPIILGREITKIHEEFVQGTPEDLQARFSTPQGEFTIVVPPQDQAENVPNEVDEQDVVALFGQITELGQGSSKREVARLVGEQLGMTAKQVYAIVERHK
jgi:16S rRNA (cytidine1402-2'-O)-methyltransferase